MHLMASFACVLSLWMVFKVFAQAVYIIPGLSIVLWMIIKLYIVLEKNGLK